MLALALTLYLSRMTVAIAADTLSSHDADYDYDPPVAGSYALPVIKMAPDGAIIDSDSKLLKLRQLTYGRITVLSFILHSLRRAESLSIRGRCFKPVARA